MSSTTWTNDSTLPGWSLFNKDNAAITSIVVGSPSTTTGSFYSFGVAGVNPVTDKALGGVASGGTYFGSPATGAVAGWTAVAVTNNSGAAISSFAIKYDGEQWRNGGNTTAQTMALEYGFGSSFATVPAWTAAGAAFNFTTTQNTATAAAIDGNAAANRTANLGGNVSATWSPGTTLWVRWIENNDAGNDHGMGVDNFSLTVNNDSDVANSSPIAFGRLMLGQTPSASSNFSKTGLAPTTYTATGSTGIALTSDGSISGGSQTETVGVQLQNNAQGSGSTGVKAYTVTLDNTAANSSATGKGSDDANATASVTATVVDNRTISASAVDLGKVIVGSTSPTKVSTLTTTGDDDHFTRVTLNGTAANDGSVTVASGAAQLFNAATTTSNRIVSGIFTSAGDKAGSVILSTTGETLAGEIVKPVSIDYTAKAYDASTAQFLANAGTMLTVDFGTFNAGSGIQLINEAIFNALQTAGFTAELDFDTISGAGDTPVLFTSLTDGAFTALTAGAANAHNFDVSFDTNSAPGAYAATYTLKLSDADTYTGAGGPGSQTLTLDLKGTIAAAAVPESTFTILLVFIVGLPVMAICRRSLA